MNLIYRKNLLGDPLSSTNQDLTTTIGPMTKSESEKVKICHNVISQLAHKYTYQFCIILPNENQPDQPVLIRASVSKSKRKKFEQSVKKISENMSNKYDIKIKPSKTGVKDGQFLAEPTMSHLVSSSLVDQGLLSGKLVPVNKSTRKKYFFHNQNLARTTSESSMDMIEPIATKSKAPRLYKFNKSLNINLMA